MTRPSGGVAKFFIFGTFVFLPVVAVSGYHGYHYTDSTTFCARACHTVMEPQAVTHGQSGHARVVCAECHIGSGASWFVKSKLSGTRQVVAMMRKSYSRPIPPAIRHLRPARDTCEGCHWPEKFFGAQLDTLVHFAADEPNTRQEIQMLLNTGGGGEVTGEAHGIHMHVSPQNRVEYIATDEFLQEIPWVKFTDATGSERVFRSDGQPLSAPPPDGLLRRMDCMDCHNRAAHTFESPDRGVNRLMAAGRIDAHLPFIKREAVRLLVQPFSNADRAGAAIRKHLDIFYQTQQPEVWVRRRPAIEQAVQALQDLYRRSQFPYMREDWRTYPNNVGHLISPGCFRCHDGRHVDTQGLPISHRCDNCHSFLNPTGQGDEQCIKRGEFRHPVALEGPHATLRCDRCHTGGVAPEPTCAGCHTLEAGYLAGRLAQFSRFDIAPDPMAEDVGCEDCHDLTKPISVESVGPRCLDCHDNEEGEPAYETLPAAWQQEAEALIEAAEARTDAAGRQLLDLLRDAGPLHNMAATRLITERLTHPGGKAAPASQPQE